MPLLPIQVQDYNCRNIERKKDCMHRSLPVEVLVSVREVVAEWPHTVLPDVIHVNAGLGHQDATKHSQLRGKQGQRSKDRPCRWEKGKLQGMALVAKRVSLSG